MDAVEFVKTLSRMCNCECYKCEIWKRLSGLESCTVWIETHPEEAVAIAEQWAAEHPVKTRILVHGCLNTCPMDVFSDTGINCNAQPCFECKKAFWLAEVEGNG